MFLKGYCLLQLKGKALCRKRFVRTLIMMTQVPDFPSRTNLKLHDIPVNFHNSYQVHK